MKNKIKKLTTYSALKNDINDILKLMIDYKNDEEMLSWCRMRIQFNIDRMLLIIKNGEDYI
jgi:hypothetical protein